MILLDPVVEVFTRPNPDWLQPTPGAILQAICRIAGNDRLPVGLAAVDDDTMRPAMVLQRLPEEVLRRRQIPMFAEKELDRIPTLSIAR
jgi:hypothetical protein